MLTPAELWQATGRYQIPELFKLTDRSGREFVLPLTHEESFTFHARELQSYRQLPQMLYHFQTKERDEPRPRGGLLRVREFVMKDAYSFDVDDEGLDRSFELQRGAYHRIFERCGLEVYEVAAESGMMGGSESQDFLAPSGSGENTLVRCERGDYAADLEIASGTPRPPSFPERLDAPDEIATPGVTTIEALAELLGIDTAATSKAMPVTRDDGAVVLALVRGDDRLSRGEARSRRRQGTGGDRGRDPGRVRRGSGVARPGRLRGRDRRRRGAPRGAVRRRREPNRVSPSRRRARARLHRSLRRPARGEARATRARAAAARSGSRPRSRSGTSSSSARSTRRRSTPPFSTRRAPSGRS